MNTTDIITDARAKIAAAEQQYRDAELRLASLALKLDIARKNLAKVERLAKSFTDDGLT